MRKWQILAFVGFTFGIIGSGWAIAEQQRAASQVYELRVYKTTPGNREALANRFRDHTAAMFERAGMTNVGYWNAVTGDDVEDTFIYMLAYPSREARDEMWRELATFEDFQEIIIAVERDENRALVDSIDARILEPTSYSALKQPKAYVRDSGLVHALLRLDDEDSVLGHPVAAASWEGFVLETLIRAAPARARASFYGTATGVEIDLLLELPDNRLWAIEIKRGAAPRVEKGLRIAMDDLRPDRTFIVYSGDERYPQAGGIEVIGLTAMADALANWNRRGRIEEK